MTDLDRLLELEVILKTVQPLEFNYAMKLEKEFESLKAKIEGKIDEGIQQEKADLLSILDMKDEEVAKLKEELETYINAESKEINQLKSTLDEIKTLAGSDTCPECMAIENLNELIAKHEDKK